MIPRRNGIVSSFASNGTLLQSAKIANPLEMSRGTATSRNRESPSVRMVAI